MLGRHRGHRLTFSDDLQEAVRLSSVIFVAVGTPPTESGEADLSYVESVAREISGGINGYKVIVEKSTVPVYTSEWVRKIILRSGTDPELFDVASNPEFLREGTAVTDFLFPDRIVIGCDSERSADVLATDLCAAHRWHLLRARRRHPAARSRFHSRAHHRDQHQERGTDQARLQRISGDEDFLHQCGRVGLRIGRCQCKSGRVTGSAPILASARAS